MVKSYFGYEEALHLGSSHQRAQSMEMSRTHGTVSQRAYRFSGSFDRPWLKPEKTAVRAAYAVISRLVGLCLKKQSVRFSMDCAFTARMDSECSETEARLLIGFMTPWTDLIVLTWRDFANLEQSWTGGKISHS